MLELKNICFTRDNKKILDNVSLTINGDKFIITVSFSRKNRLFILS